MLALTDVPYTTYVLGTVLGLAPFSFAYVYISVFVKEAALG